MRKWTFQDAQEKFAELVSAALAGEPQRILLQDKSRVVILAENEYDRLRRLEESHVPSLSGSLLEIPQDDQDFDRPNITPRALED